VVNKVILIGGLSKDPEMRFLPDSTAIAQFSVATQPSKAEPGTIFQSARADAPPRKRMMEGSSPSGRRFQSARADAPPRKVCWTYGCAGWIRVSVRPRGCTPSEVIHLPIHH
jgi:hypothetical protein